MKNRLLTIAMVVLSAVGMISCGNPAGPGEFILTKENIDNYIIELANYEGLTVAVSRNTFSDKDVEEYAQYYYDSVAKQTEGMTDEEGNVVPMTDQSVRMLDGEFTSVNDYLVFIRKTVKDFYEISYQNDIVQEAITQVAVNSTFAEELPEGLIEKEKAFINEQFSEIAANYSLSVEDYLKYCDTSLEELAEEYAKQELVCFKIAKEEDLWNGTDEEADQAVFDFIVDVTKVME